MNDINLTHKLRQRMAGRARVRGRYSVSELYFMTRKGRYSITPDQWTHAPEKEVKRMLSMWNGIGMHSQLEYLLGEENSDKKIEIVYKDIVLVGKADFVPPNKDEVWEFKSSDELMDKMKPYQKHQAKMYCTLFNKSKGIVYQPVQNDYGVYLKNIGEVERDDEWFEKEMEKLYDFHKEVEKLWNK